PFQAETPLETLRQVRELEPMRPRALNPHLDRDLETVCLKCLEKEPSRRYGSAQELADDLERWLRSEPVRARRHRLWQRAAKWARRRPRTAALLLLLCLVPLLGWAAAQWQHLSAQWARAAEERQAREYLEKLTQAREALTANQRDKAEGLLEQCPARLRGWEWYCFKRLCHEGPVT